MRTLYKDIHYLIKDIDKPGENDLEIKNGDIVIEDGDIKLTGYQSRLHNLAIWLNMEIAKKCIEDNPLTFIEAMENFEKNLNKSNYTPEYKRRLNQIFENT